VTLEENQNMKLPFELQTTPPQVARPHYIINVMCNFFRC